jgi:hypothetical protein
MLKQGMSIGDISKLGRLKDTSKVVGRLTKQGVTADQIKQLQGGPMGLGLPAASYGGSGGAAPSDPAPDMSPFFNSPGYQFRRDEGLRDIGNSFAARGGAFGGDALRGITDFNQNLASEDYYNYINQLNSMVGFGQNATNNATNIGQNFANAGSQAIGNYGDARASGIMGQTGFGLAGLGGAAQAFGNYWDNRAPRTVVDPRIYDSNYGGNSGRIPR